MWCAFAGFWAEKVFNFSQSKDRHFPALIAYCELELNAFFSRKAFADFFFFVLPMELYMWSEFLFSGIIQDFLWFSWVWVFCFVVVRVFLLGV